MEEAKIYIKTKDKITEREELGFKKVLQNVPTLSDLEYPRENWASAKINKNIPATVRDTSVALIIAEIICDDIVLDGVKEVKHPVEMITDSEQLKQEIEYENDIFNLEEFYSKSLDGSAIVITKDKMIRVYSWIDHGQTVLNVYNYLYDKNIQESTWNGVIWQYEALDKGNIIIQLCDNCSSPTWLPTEMNDYQYNTLINLVENLIEIEEKTLYGIELALEGNGNVTSIKDAKDKINDICREKGIYDVPRTK